MALHPHFPADPHAPLLPDERWFPAAEDLRATACGKPPPLATVGEDPHGARPSAGRGVRSS